MGPRACEGRTFFIADGWVGMTGEQALPFVFTRDSEVALPTSSSKSAWEREGGRAECKINAGAVVWLDSVHSSSLQT